jgi:aconitase B
VDECKPLPVGISFPAGSGLVAFGAATGVIPLVGWCSLSQSTLVESAWNSSLETKT